jgi:flagellar motor switch protein FliM
METTAETSAPSSEPILEPAAGLPITPDVQVEHQPFRFTAAASLPAARLEALEAWHRPFLRLASANLRSTLRLDVELELESIRVESCAQALAGRDEKNQALLFRMAPQPDLWLLDLPLPLALFGVERMTGGSLAVPAADDPAARELTELELIILKQFSLSLLGDYARNWPAPVDYKPEIVRLARTARVPRAIGHLPEDLLVRVALDLVLKDAKSTFAVYLPIAVVEELLQRLGAHEDTRKPAATAPAQPHAKSPLASVPVPISVCWQGFQISLRDLESLAPGDLIVLDQKRCGEGVVFLGDRARFAGKVARDAHKTVITLTHPLE